MSQGYQRFERYKLVAQAALVWTQAGPKALAEFIDEGRLPDDGKDDVEPYDQNLVKQIVATGRVG
jgi:hypothetical protein